MHPHNACMSGNNPNQDVIAINPNAKVGQMNLAAKIGVGYYCSRGPISTMGRGCFAQ